MRLPAASRINVHRRCRPNTQYRAEERGELNATDLRTPAGAIVVQRPTAPGVFRLFFSPGPYSFADVSAVPNPSDVPHLAASTSSSAADASVAEPGVAQGGNHAAHGHGPIHSHCENCGAKLQGPYCHVCGQHDFPFHASFRHVFLEALENFFHFEGKFFRNVITLLFRPGDLTAEFNAGKRASQMPPFRLYLFVSVLFFVSFFANSVRPPVAPTARADTRAARKEAAHALEQAPTKLEPAARDAADRLRNPAGKDIDGGGSVHAAGTTGGAATSRPSTRRNWSDSIARLFQPMESESFREKLLEQFMHTMPRLLLVALPLFALYTRLLFRGTEQVYIQHLVLALHYHTFVYLWLLLRDGWSGMASLASPTFGSVIEGLCNLWTFVYPVLMLRRLFGNSWGRTITKAAILTVVYSLTLTLIFLTGFVILLAYD